MAESGENSNLDSVTVGQHDLFTYALRDIASFSGSKDSDCFSII